jgi:hypothetical protein
VSGAEDIESIVVGDDHRMRVRRRLVPARRIRPLAVIAAVVVTAGAAVGVYLFQSRPEGFAAVDGAAVVSAGAYQSKIAGDTITVAMEIRNVTDETVTVVSARIVAPTGLTQLAIALLAPGERNRNLNLDAELPALTPVTLGTAGVDRNGFVAARFQVDCAGLPPTTGVTGERVFVTVRLGDDQREEELTPPVLGGTPWLTATGRNACQQPGTPTAIPTPLPTL